MKELITGNGDETWVKTYSFIKSGEVWCINYMTREGLIEVKEHIEDLLTNKTN